MFEAGKICFISLWYQCQCGGGSQADKGMGTIFLHLIAGTLGSLAVFLAFIRLSGARSFSAPFGVIFIGIACATLAHFVSPWATPAIIVAYAVFSAIELWQDRKAQKKPGGSQNVS